MKKYVNDLSKHMYVLCDMYKKYVLKNDKSKLNVLIQNCAISFKIFNNVELIDEFIINFNDRENDIYFYISVIIMKRLFDDFAIYDGDNIIYNKLDDANIILEVNDMNILDIMHIVINNYGLNNDVNKINIVDILHNNLSWRLYPRKFMKSLDERVSLSRKLLRMDGRQ